MMRRLGLALVLLCAVCCFAQEAELPQDIRDMYAGFYAAIRTGDAEAASGYLCLYARLQSHFAGMGGHGDVRRIVDTYDIRSLEPVFLSCLVKDERAEVQYDLEIQGPDKKTEEEKAEVWRRLDRLMRVGDGWMILETCQLDPARMERDIKDGFVRDEEAGVQFPIPEGWQPSILAGMAGLVATLSAPDILTSATVVMVDMPVKMSAKEIAEIYQTALVDVLGLTMDVLSQGDATLAGKPAYEVKRQVTADFVTVDVRSIFRVDETEAGDVLYGLIFTLELPDAADTFKSEFEQIETGLQIGPRKKQELPAELGRIADGRYVNPKYGITMDIAEGWQAQIARSRFLFQLTLSAPEGKSTLLLAALDIGQWVAPETIAQAALAQAQKQDPNLNILGEGPRNKGPLEGYETLWDLTLPGGGARRRWSVYFPRDTILFFLIGEAIPPEEYENVKDDWAQMLDSLTFGPAAQD